MKTSDLRYWLAASRLRTLPLAAASILCGGYLALVQGNFRPGILLLCLATALALQIFSNLANDYGDAQNGADHNGRQGPARMVASGRLSAAAMRRALLIMALICCLLGILLLSTALSVSAIGWLFWLAVGAACILAAYRYTAGSQPYGYAGWGDAAVCLFFGWVGVLGSAYLQTGEFEAAALLPATALGLWCSMVLNLNNMRDIRSDLAAGKLTVAARLGLSLATHYHHFLALLAAALWTIWLIILPDNPVWPHFVLWLLTGFHLFQVRQVNGYAFDPLLPRWSLSVLLWSILLCFSA